MSEIADKLIDNFNTASRDVQKVRSTSNLELFMDAWNSLSGYIEELESRITELSQAVGLITTMKPTMVMDANHPLDMAKEVAEYVTARIAELEAAQRWIPVKEKLPNLWETVLIWAYYDSGRYDRFDLAFNNGSVWVGTKQDIEYEDVTHWMPLPEPPIVYGKESEE